MVNEMTASGRRRKRMQGKGFMDFINGVGNFLKDNVLPVAKDIGIGLIKKQIGLGKRRKLKKRGGAKKPKRKIIHM